MDALCEALRRTESRGAAAALVATWRAPVRRPRQIPLALPPPPPGSAAPPPLPREEQVKAGLAAIRAIEAASGGGEP